MKPLFLIEKRLARRLKILFMKRLLAIVIFLLPSVSFSQNIDIRLLRAINSPGSLPSDGFFRTVSNANIYVITGVPVTIAVAGFAAHDDGLLKNAAVIGAGTILTFGITTAIKYTVNRARPFVTYPDIADKSHKTYHDPSFPSGHTSSVFATATALSLEYPKWYVIAPSFAFAGTVAYSRMHLGVHYPSDVLAGAIIGSGCAVIAHLIGKKINFPSNR